MKQKLSTDSRKCKVWWRQNYLTIMYNRLTHSEAKRRNGRLKNLIKVRCKTTYLLPVIIKGFSTFFFTLKIFIHCFHSLWLALFCNEEKSHKITRKLCVECVPRVHRAYCLAWKCFLLYIKSFQMEQKKISPPLFRLPHLAQQSDKMLRF